ncbi:MAG: hypothetical protein N2746_03515, partial [Deltaproteobacteria bacterium]|nr:hypothetical protein [Deltaproteobacteria bacterium]
RREDTIYVRDVVMDTEVDKDVYLVNGRIRGVRVVDSRGREVSVISSEWAEEMYFDGAKVHIKVRGGEYKVYDVSEVRNPIYMGRYDEGESVMRYEYAGRYAIEKIDKGIRIKEVRWK